MYIYMAQNTDFEPRAQILMFILNIQYVVLLVEEHKNFNKK